MNQSEITEAAAGVRKQETQEEIMSKIKHRNEVPLDKDNILKHFGYDPDIYRNTGGGWWLSSEAFENMPFLKRYEEQLMEGKARIVIDYDPGYSKVILRIEKLP